MTEELHGLQTHPLYLLLSDIAPHRLRDTDSAFPCPAAGLEAASQPCSAALIAISHTLPPLRTFTGTLHWVVAREGANSHLAVRDVLADPLLEVRPGRLGHSRTAQCCYV
jgi:hypothetical protein